MINKYEQLITDYTTKYDLSIYEIDLFTYLVNTFPEEVLIVDYDIDLDEYIYNEDMATLLLLIAKLFGDTKEKLHILEEINNSNYLLTKDSELTDNALLLLVDKLNFPYLEGETTAELIAEIKDKKELIDKYQMIIKNKGTAFALEQTLDYFREKYNYDYTENISNKEFLNDGEIRIKFSNDLINNDLEDDVEKTIDILESGVINQYKEISNNHLLYKILTDIKPAGVPYKLFFDYMISVITHDSPAHDFRDNPKVVPEIKVDYDLSTIPGVDEVSNTYIVKMSGTMPNSSLTNPSMSGIAPIDERFLVENMDKIVRIDVKNIAQGIDEEDCDFGIYQSFEIKYNNTWSYMFGPSLPFQWHGDDQVVYGTTFTFYFEMPINKIYQEHEVTVTNPPAINFSRQTLEYWKLNNEEVEFPYTTTANITFTPEIRVHPIITVKFYNKDNAQIGEDRIYYTDTNGKAIILKDNITRPNFAGHDFDGWLLDLTNEIYPIESENLELTVTEDTLIKFTATYIEQDQLQSPQFTTGPSHTERFDARHINLADTSMTYYFTVYNPNDEPVTCIIKYGNTTRTQQTITAKGTYTYTETWPTTERITGSYTAQFSKIGLVSSSIATISPSSWVQTGKPTLPTFDLTLQVIRPRWAFNDIDVDETGSGCSDWHFNFLYAILYFKITNHNRGGWGAYNNYGFKYKGVTDTQTYSVTSTQTLHKLLSGDLGAQHTFTLTVGNESYNIGQENPNRTIYEYINTTSFKEDRPQSPGFFVDNAIDLLKNPTRAVLSPSPTDTGFYLVCMVYESDAWFGKTRKQCGYSFSGSKIILPEEFGVKFNNYPDKATIYTYAWGDGKPYKNDQTGGTFSYKKELFKGDLTIYKND